MSVPQASRFTQYVRRLFSLKGGYDPSVLEDIFPTIQLHDPTEPNLAHMRGVRLVNGTIAVTAGVGFFPAAEINTNRSSETLPPFLFDLDLLVVANQNAGVATLTIEHIFETTGTIGANQMTPGDGRRLKAGDGVERPESLTVMLGFGNSFNAFLPQRSFAIPIAANSSLILATRGWTLFRSSLLLKLGFAQGSALFSFQGRERLLEPSEVF